MHDSATLEFMIISWEILAAVIAWILVYIIIRETTGRYTGIDNSEGDCWTEDFETMDEVMEWLGGGQ